MSVLSAGGHLFVIQRGIPFRRAGTRSDRPGFTACSFKTWRSEDTRPKSFASELREERSGPDDECDKACSRQSTITATDFQHAPTSRDQSAFDETISDEATNALRKTAVPQADALLAGQVFSSKLPRHRSVVVGEETRRTVGTDQSHLYCLLCSLLDRLIAMRTLLLTDIASDALSTHFVPGTLHNCLA